MNGVIAGTSVGTTDPVGDGRNGRRGDRRDADRIAEADFSPDWVVARAMSLDPKIEGRSARGPCSEREAGDRTRMAQNLRIVAGGWRCRD